MRATELRRVGSSAAPGVARGFPPSNGGAGAATRADEHLEPPLWEVGADGMAPPQMPGPQLGGVRREAGGWTAGEAGRGRCERQPRVPAADDAPSSAAFEVAVERKEAGESPVP